LENRRAGFSGDRGAYSVPQFHSAINWDNPDSFSTPGAPPNGADYVRLRGATDARKKYLSTADLRTIEFTGARTLPSEPMGWTSVTNAPDHAGNPALFSGVASTLDRAAITSVTVPAADPSLTFQTKWDLEPQWDFGVVQVSTDGGKTWTSLANGSTTAEHDPGALNAIVANLPGYTGSSGGWVPQRFDLSRWAGQNVLLSFRMMTDTNTEGPGWWVDDIAVGGQVVSDGSSTRGFRSQTEVNPKPVAGFTVQLVGYSSTGRGPVFVTTLKLDANFHAKLNVPFLWRLYGADTVAAIVAYDEPTESITQYAPYELKVNGLVQPGGGTLPATTSPAPPTTPPPTTPTPTGVPPTTVTTTVPTTPTSAAPTTSPSTTSPPATPSTAPSTSSPAPPPPPPPVPPTSAPGPTTTHEHGH
jgi:hypothetical protein